MNPNDFLTVAAYQGGIIEKDIDTNLLKAIKVTQIAEERGVEILCFPESYLHGYFNDKASAFKHSIDLQSQNFKVLCKKFAAYQRTTILLGLNELEESKIYNTVVVIEKGQCIGKYRKAYTYPPYDYFSLGQEFPIFEKKGIKYGIIICLDSTRPEPAKIAALKGAKILFCPMFNRISKTDKMIHHLHSKNHFITRAFDNHCYFVASDIIWNDEKEVCAGHSCILNNAGDVIVRATPFEENLLIYSIPIASLQKQKKHRVFGKKELFDIVKETYNQSCYTEFK
jgi:predicted amidohydrolase